MITFEILSYRLDGFSLFLCFDCQVRNEYHRLHSSHNLHVLLGQEKKPLIGDCFTNENDLCKYAAISLVMKGK